MNGSIARAARPTWLRADSRLLRLAIASLVVAFSLMGLSSEPHRADAYFGVNIHSHHFNMCSAACGTSSQARDLVVSFFVNDQAWSSAVVEACASDISNISGRIGVPGYVWYSIASNPACPGTDKRQGNAIFPVGVFRGAQGLRFQSNTANSGFVCAEMDTYAGIVVPCSSHLECCNNAIAKAQAGEYVTKVTFIWPTRGKWLAGDFNLTDPDIPQTYKDNYYYSFVGFTFKLPSPLNKQIDYIWHDKAHSASNSPQAPYCNAFYSDHCFTSAHFT
jgi:hypothetical protein